MAKVPPGRAEERLRRAGWDGQEKLESQALALLSGQ